jgi:hypothetical protein
MSGDHRAVLLACALACALASLSCSDPVRDMNVERLGPEADGVSPGPLHRPGQPCLVCHAERGPASHEPFAVAGTVFETADARSPFAPRVEIHVRDAENHSPGVFVTNQVGNFFITEKDWPDMAFPLRVGLRRDGKTIEMGTTVNREGSCNFCHRPATGSRLAIPGDEPRTSIGPIVIAGAQ